MVRSKFTPTRIVGYRSGFQGAATAVVAIDYEQMSRHMRLLRAKLTVQRLTRGKPLRANRSTTLSGRVYPPVSKTSKTRRQRDDIYRKFEERYTLRGRGGDPLQHRMMVG